MAAPIPKEFINDLLNQCDIVTLISHFIHLRKEGNNHVACCPFHEESTPSFKVDEAKQLYHCFGCKVGGNAINFIRAYEKLDFLPAVEWLANHLQIKLPNQGSHDAATTNRIKALYAALEDAASFYESQLYKTPAALNYLKKRDLTEKSIQQFKLGFASSSWDSLGKYLTRQKKHTPSTLKAAGLIVQKNEAHYYDRFRSRIIFPIRDKQGRCIGLGGRVLDAAHEPKYLNSPETMLFHKNQALYGLHESLIDRKNLRRFWVVEGYLDVIMLHQFGIKETVATLGTATSRFHLQQLFRLTEEVIFCFDGDIAGKRAAVRALELSLSILQDNYSLKFLLLPAGEDPDSWVRKATEDQRENLAKEAISLEDFFFRVIQQGASLETMEGQRAILQKAAPFLKRLPSGIRREQILQRLARLVNIEVNKLQNLSSYKPPFKKALHTQQKKAYTVVDRTIGLLLQYPKELFSHLPLALSPRIKAEYPLLDTVINKIRENADIHTAALLEQFREETSLAQHLMQLAQYDWLVPAEGVVAEFEDILIHLDKSLRARKIKSLIQKARQNTITPQEKNELTHLLSEQ